MTDRPIADYALLGDCHSAALVGTNGSVDWLCFPRFDSASVFGRLLGREAGFWRLAPAGDAQVTRRYLDQSLILETTFRCDTGVVTLTDLMPVGPNEDGHGLGATAPHALLRLARCVEGSVEMQTTFAPRPEYGLAKPTLLPAPGGIVSRGGPDSLALATPLDLEIGHGTAHGRFRLSGGQTAAFALQWARAWDPSPRVWHSDEIADRIETNWKSWRSWSEIHQGYDGPYRDLVLHSGRVLQGLTFQPTGAIVAAATTSLPETVGGERNWDYRYSWVRDASLTLDALWIAACPDEATAFFDWMVDAAGAELAAGGHLQIMFGVGGEHDLSERELHHLEGWRDSRPVRVGNAAWLQSQLDVYGELLDATARLAPELGRLDRPTRLFLAGLAETAADHWEDPDPGIWEVRGEPQHFLYSKLMCWVALDRAIRLADAIDEHANVRRWRRVRREIRDAILEQGFNEKAGAYTQAFGSDILDASVLMLAITGFLPASDERMAATIRAIEERLTDERGLVYRYEDRTDDGLAGKEGSFLLCTFWLAHCHALAGDVGKAREVFERAAALRNDVDLLAEEADAATGELLGNFPQAFSHVGLITAACAIGSAEGAANLPHPPGPAPERPE